jgi:endonuclease-3
VPRIKKRRPDAAFAARILDVLEGTHPEARCALDYKNAFQLAVATILSAQCTDERVNLVTPRLFERFPDAAALARADPAELEDIVRSTGFYRAKAKSLIGFSKGLVERHGGAVPRTMAELVPLPGIGRKTANVVLGHAFDVNEGIAVDTHVLRVGNRLGLVEGDDPLKVEQQLMALVPRERWTRTTDLLIFHGRKICDARRPDCGACPVFAECRWESRLAWAHGRPPIVRRPQGTRSRPARPAAALARPSRVVARRPAGRPLRSRGRTRGGTK